MRTVQLLVPGSHRWTPEERRTWQDWVKPEDVISLRVPPGTVLLWRSTMLHAVTPHRAPSWRLHLMYSFVPRWFRPSYRSSFKNIENDPALLESCSPIKRQLLGQMGNLEGADEPGAAGTSRYLFPAKPEHVPLKGWAEENGWAEDAADGAPKDPPGGPGVTGHGTSWSQALDGTPTPTLFGVNTSHAAYFRQGSWRGASPPQSPLSLLADDGSEAKVEALEAEVRQLRRQLRAAGAQQPQLSSKL